MRAAKALTTYFPRLRVRHGEDFVGLLLHVCFSQNQKYLTIPRIETPDRLILTLTPHPQLNSFEDSEHHRLVRNLVY